MLESTQRVYFTIDLIHKNHSSSLMLAPNLHMGIVLFEAESLLANTSQLKQVHPTHTQIVIIQIV